MAVDLNTFISRFWNSRLPIISSGGGSASGVLTVSSTSAATIADTNETTLWTYDLPANTLSADGRIVRVTVWGTVAANADTKTIKLYFGSSSFTLNDSTTAPNGVGWTSTALYTRTGSGAQSRTKLYALFGATNQFPSAGGTASETDTAAITIKITGTNGTAAANDIVFKGALVELLN
jgi:hypothetical protein